MNLTRVLVCAAGCVVGCVAVPSALADITTAKYFKLEIRNINMYPSSVITTTSFGSSRASISEVMNPPGSNDPAGIFNRHLAAFSADGGHSILALINSEPFHISFKMTMNSNVDGGSFANSFQPVGGLQFVNPRDSYFDVGGLFVRGSGEISISGANQKSGSLATGSVTGFVKGDELALEYFYYPPGIKGPEAAYRAVFTNLSKGMHKETANTFDASNPEANGFNDGAWVALRFENARNYFMPESTVNETKYWDVQVASCPADLDGDDAVDDADFVRFVAAYDRLLCEGAPNPCNADVNRDGVVDDADFGVFVVAYDVLTCP